MDDLEEFLRRAAEKRQARKAGGGRRPEPPRQQAPPPRQAPPQRPPARRLQPPPEQIVPEAVMEAEIIEEPGIWGKSVEGHVSQHLSRAEMQRRGGDFGRSIDEADDKLDSHLHEVFDHQVGRLGGKAKSQITDEVQDAYQEKKPQVVEPGLSIPELLANPETLRNAFLLSEVFKRPEF